MLFRSRFLKGVKPLVLYDVDRGVVMEPVQGKLASSQFDFGYTHTHDSVVSAVLCGEALWARRLVVWEFSLWS